MRRSEACPRSTIDIDIDIGVADGTAASLEERVAEEAD